MDLIGTSLKTQMNFFTCFLGCPMSFPKDSFKGNEEY